VGVESVPGSNIKESATMATSNIIRRRYWKLIAGLLASYAGIVGVATVVAGEIDAAPPQVVVKLGDLNLRDSRGVAVAYNRLLWAAQRVCMGADSSDYWVRESAAPCEFQAVSQAIDSIGEPRLAAYAQVQPLFRLRHTETVARAD
jgi:UrcA family protein